MQVLWVRPLGVFHLFAHIINVSPILIGLEIRLRNALIAGESIQILKFSGGGPADPPVRDALTPSHTLP